MTFQSPSGSPHALHRTHLSIREWRRHQAHEQRQQDDRDAIVREHGIERLEQPVEEAGERDEPRVSEVDRASQTRTEHLQILLPLRARIDPEHPLRGLPGRDVDRIEVHLHDRRVPRIRRLEAGVRERGLIGKHRTQEVRDVDAGPIDLVRHLDAARRIAAEETWLSKARDRRARDAALVQRGETLILEIGALDREHGPIDTKTWRDRDARSVLDFDAQCERITVGLELVCLADHDAASFEAERDRILGAGLEHEQRRAVSCIVTDQPDRSRSRAATRIEFSQLEALERGAAIREFGDELRPFDAQRASGCFRRS